MGRTLERVAGCRREGAHRVRAGDAGVERPGAASPRWSTGSSAHRFDSLWLSERVTGDCPDPIVGLARGRRAARPSSSSGSRCSCVPGRNPMLLAKELATLDRLVRRAPAARLRARRRRPRRAPGLRGRARRAGQARSTRCCRCCAGSGPARPSTTTATFHHYEGAVVRPLPAAGPARDLARRHRARRSCSGCGRLGDGWLPSFCTPEDVRDGIAVIERDRRRARPQDRPGALRRPDPLHATARSPTSSPPASPGAAPASTRPGDRVRPRRPPDDDRASTSTVGGSKFVVIPLAEPDDWDDHLGRGGRRPPPAADLTTVASPGRRRGQR